MVELLTGVPGSGKTYYAVLKLCDYAKDGKYKSVFTNINGLKNDDLNKINQKTKFFTLNYDDLYEDMQLEYDFYLQNKKIDNYDEKIRENGIFAKYYDSLIVIDECQMILKENDVTKRFITYHRHFKIDILLITQAKHLLPKVFTSNVERMIVAQPATKRFFGSGFRYFFYSSFQLYKTNIYDRKTIKFNQKIANYYDSGNDKKSPPIIQKVVLPIIVLIVIVFFAYHHWIAKFSKQTENNKTLNSVTSNIVYQANKSQVHDIEQYSNFLIRVSCFSNKYCTIKGNNFIFLESALNSLIREYKCLKKYSQSSLGKDVFVISCENSQINQILGALNEKTIDNNQSVTSLKLF